METSAWVIDESDQDNWSWYTYYSGGVSAEDYRFELNATMQYIASAYSDPEYGTVTYFTPRFVFPVATPISVQYSVFVPVVDADGNVAYNITDNIRGSATITPVPGK